MKLSDITKIVKKNKEIYIIDSYGEQWIGNGECYVLTPDLPKLDESNIFTLLSIEKTESEKYELTERKCSIDSSNYENTDDSAIAVVGMTFYLNGGEYTALYTEKGAVLVNTFYLLRFGHMPYRKLILRNCGLSSPAVAVFDGLLLCGYIIPAFIDEGTISYVSNLVNNLMRAKANKLMFHGSGEANGQMEI